MRLLPIIAASLALLSAPAFAQTDTTTAPATTATPAPAKAKVATKRHVKRVSKANPALGGQKPIDVGPNTPDANRAYQGGGVILQGAPGAPAPMPAPTPPGQVPANSVPR